MPKLEWIMIAGFSLSTFGGAAEFLLLRRAERKQAEDIERIKLELMTLRSELVSAQVRPPQAPTDEKTQMQTRFNQMIDEAVARHQLTAEAVKEMRALRTRMLQHDYEMLLRKLMLAVNQGQVKLSDNPSFAV